MKIAAVTADQRFSVPKQRDKKKHFTTYIYLEMQVIHYISKYLSTSILPRKHKCVGYTAQNRETPKNFKVEIELAQGKYVYPGHLSWSTHEK